MVAKKLVEVAFVEVDCRAVKFWRVVDEVWRAFKKLERPPVAVRLVPIESAPVEVALVLVALRPVKFCKVEEEFTWSCPGKI